MNSIYWITRLDAICSLFEYIDILAIIVFLISSFVYILNRIIEDDGEKEMVDKATKKFWLISTPIMVVSSLFLTFIPTTKEAYQIYGIGGTIDYIKSNKEAQKIPDKAIKALNCFLDNECKTDTTKNE